MSGFVVVIPARYGSSRLPGKPLLDIGGRPMVAHVWQRAQESGASRIVVATDDARIVEAVEAFGGEAILTRADHPSGTDRLAEVARHLALDDDTIVINVQGDEPLLPATLIDQVARRLEADPHASIATLAEPIGDVDTLFNPNVVKVVRDVHGRALYFSRAPIPWDREAFRARPELLDTDAWLRHVGLYAYRAGFLAEYVGWLPSPLEQLEQLEQLRALHQGHRIQVALSAEPHPPGVDTPEDLARVRRLIDHSATGGND
ncbi:3-deoxy-manno-octulosonate cytidylyltransferase [Halomonas sp. McH1-25]|uniref:3-deoxy-manno-octulosonate cytidylyltransferase n=1 Tax=unclassified Halomonas TaxID=2609666 RepID=UPI001EF4036D|nr:MULTISPECIES: 3-deoxy-manno-octulosonate cytidylyltransferase [unclassified Halomonas]MCG7599040.1 3-deoxy-manno-octulosonate cytidylyltransferase [Halomonas sp. McH1-25]MCP1344361.1 3-deoxy-manno-octulosonate cytidylyltransferase [Halomonas sp. FL8]MCP1360313.1 3-deoxy-manno-octulosonate cytidylyltransferase [Halomonas sp. BBD45]MCP1367793.1 3-deoxy-manno-octulosonate cytidylyltransferase [Halomonas sp. BBD48]